MQDYNEELEARCERLEQALQQETERSYDAKKLIQMLLLTMAKESTEKDDIVGRYSKETIGDKAKRKAQTNLREISIRVGCDDPPKMWSVAQSSYVSEFVVECWRDPVMKKYIDWIRR